MVSAETWWQVVPGRQEGVDSSGDDSEDAFRDVPLPGEILSDAASASPSAATYRPSPRGSGSSGRSRKPPRQSHILRISRLLNNDCARALGRGNSSSSRSISRISLRTPLPTPVLFAQEENLWDQYSSAEEIDWSLEENLQRLRQVRHLARNFFVAFRQDVGTDLPVRMSPWRQWLFHAVGVIQVVSTIYAIFGPDVWLLYGESPHQSFELALLNTAVLGIFLLEIVGMCFLVPGYTWSLQFLVDLVATLSMVGETVVAYELVHAGSNNDSGGKAPSFMLNLQSSRLIRLARNVRIVQMLRIFPTIDSLTRWRNRKLAWRLAQKRMSRLLHFVREKNADKQFDISDVELLNAALDLEFPMPRASAWRRACSGLMNLYYFGHVLHAALQSYKQGSPHAERSAANSFECDLVRDFLATPRGCHMTEVCQEDFRALQGSQPFMDRMKQQMVLKVCLSVIVVLIVLPLLELHIADDGDFQVLALLDAAAHGSQGGELDICSLIRRYMGLSENSLLFLALGTGTYWDEACGCCEPPWSVGEDPRDRAQAVMDGSGFQAHELLLFCLPDPTCAGAPPRSVAVFDTHARLRGTARGSLVYSLIGVALMLAAVFCSHVERRRLESWLLDPIRDLMDDIVKLSSIQGIEVTDDTYNIPLDVSEMTDMRRAMVSMKSALRSWVKYVPVCLITKLYNAGVEAQLGVQYRTVTVFFCDFDGLQAELTPQALCNAREAVYDIVAETVDAHSGTLLEFIDNEILSVFNAPKSVENHPRQAMLAALAVQERVRVMNGDCCCDQGPRALRLRMGIHTARVLVGNVGAPTRIKYGMLGDGVNLAARLKSLNSHYGTSCLVSEDTLDLGGHDQFITRPIGHLVLKGRTHPTNTWEVMGVHTGALTSLCRAASTHTRGFDLFLTRDFEGARDHFEEACSLLAELDRRANSTDGPSLHLMRLCNEYISAPPPADWDGSEMVKRK